MLHTFTPFLRLPLEIRLMIWKYAMPGSRVILVQDAPLIEEHPDPDAEAEHYGNLDRDVETWASVPRHFSCRRQGHTRFLPWKCAPKCQYTEDRVRLFTRNPILPLLQACRESRHLMQGCGYSLSFASRYALPMTWFNFDTDILYLRQSSCNCPEDGDFLTHYPILWQSKFYTHFKQTDLARVKKLALSIDQNCVRKDGNGVADGDFLKAIYITFFSNTIKPLRNLEELLIVVEDVVDFKTRKPQFDEFGQTICNFQSRKQTGLVQPRPEENRDELLAIDCELSPNLDMQPKDILESPGHRMVRWDDSYSASYSNYFHHIARLIENMMKANRDAGAFFDRPVAKWSAAPKVRFVIMATEEGERRLLRWKMDYNLRKQRMEDEDAMSTVMPPSITVEEEGAMWEAETWPSATPGGGFSVPFAFTIFRPTTPFTFFFTLLDHFGMVTVRDSTR